MKTQVVVPLEQLKTEPFASVLCYPQPNIIELENRLKELATHSAVAVEFSGKATAHGISVPLLGKGFVGIVAIAHLKNGQRVALKILRTDADRPDLLHEAHMLTQANSVVVGPKLVGASQNFLLTQLIEGELLPKWLKTCKEKAVVREALAQVLEQCWRLDKLGLDHGELSKAPKHVIIDKNYTPFLLDFETASSTRKPANVTAICNFLFTSTGKVARAIAEVLGERNREKILETLHRYRRCPIRENFSQVAETCLG